MLIVDWLVAMDLAVYVLVKFIRGLLYFSLNILHCTSLTFHCDLNPVASNGHMPLLSFISVAILKY